MSISNRCEQCHRIISVSLDQCPKCGCLIKTKNYVVIYRIGGRRVYKYIGRDLTLAKKVDADKKLEAKLGRLPEQYRPVKKTTFRHFLTTLFLPHFRHKNKGKAPEHIFNYFLSVFQDAPLRSVTPSDVERALIAGWGGLAPATYNYALAVIKRIFNYATGRFFACVHPTG